MKTRIISASVLIAVVVGFIALGKTVNRLFITAFVMAAAAIAVYELLNNALGLKVKSANLAACAYAASIVMFRDGYIRLLEQSKLKIGFALAVPFIVTIFYFCFAVAVILVKHKDFNIASIFGFCAMPMFLAYGFGFLNSIINHSNGIYYILLLLNFSSVCDTGAYFVGCGMGRHKLCPEISPKKTVEGALGGIVSSIIVSLVIVLCFKRLEGAAALLILTVPMCVLGMMGDLFASVIKRNVGIKDYGNLIPGHGGVLDRFDSMLLIAPMLYILIALGIL